MPEQTVCFNLLQDQRKAILEMYLFNMTVLARIVLDVDETEDFMNKVRESVMPTTGFMKGYIRAAEERYPHVYGPGQRCKFCSELRKYDD